MHLPTRKLGMRKYLINEPEGFSCEVISLLDRNSFKRTFDPLEAEIVFVRFRERVDPGFLERHKSIRYIVSPTTGLCHIDIEACTMRGVSIITLRDCKEYMEQIRSTSEFTLMMMLSILRRFHQACYNQYDVAVKDRMIYRGTDLCDKTVGILGYGRIGKHVHEYIKAFRAKPIVWDADANKISSLPTSEAAASMDDLLCRSQILSLHVDLNESTIGLINARALSLLPTGSVIINTSRAQVINKSDLVSFIRSGHVGAYASDVMWDESAPTLDRELLDLAKEGYNILLTPHIAGCTLTSMNRTEAFVTRKLINTLAARGEI